MYSTSIVLQCLFLAFVTVCLFARAKHAKRVFWMSFKHAPCYPKEVIGYLLDPSRVIASIAGMAVSALVFAALGWWVLSIGYLALFLLDYLISFGIVGYWYLRRRYNNECL